MKRGYLRDCFSGVGVKRLSGVDAEPGKSNQHEVGTTRAMREQFLGEDQRRKFPVTYVWLGENQDGLTVEGTATHYDTRATKAHRSPEWRLYYPSNPVTEMMKEGDTLFLAITNDWTRLWFIIAQEGSTSEQQLSWLFDLHPKGWSFVSRGIADDEKELGFAARFILEEIGIEVEGPEVDNLDAIIDPLGIALPPTAEFSDLARRSLPEVSPRDDPDGALLAWLVREEALFRRLERRIVAERLEQGFMTPDGADVDGFISYSLSIQNRRKSRMGFSLEHHVAAVLDAWNIAYERQAMTENMHRPDFLFPSAAAYWAAQAGDPGLKMLGVKSTCKERWRQVLAEAAKIPQKHLLTLEPGISEPQTNQMQAVDLQLIIPLPIHDSYSERQQVWLQSLADFVGDLSER